ncbi:amino acid adenylation domain-containing protein [Niallia sp. Krafla_26]|uniref:amino acid adenylation domain-containing protein n=1 Tax=Niallia sp. Krafla_26 TaxID=3064703 RepID=UPI003D180277
MIQRDVRGSITYNQNILSQYDELNQYHIKSPEIRVVHEYFEEQVRKHPHHIAVKKNSVVLTYDQLNRRANQVAHALRKREFAKESIIAIYMNFDISYIVSIIGILKAGYTYLPLDREFPIHRIKKMLDIANASLIMINDYDDGGLLPANVPVIEFEETVLESEENVDNVNSPEDLAYIMFTSGTTGEPKGVMIPHKGILPLVKNNSSLPITKKGCFLQTSSFTFDVSVFEMWGGLLNEMTLVMTEKKDLLDADVMRRMIEGEKITEMYLSSALFSELARQNPAIFHSITTLFVAGDILSVQSSKKVLEACPHLKLINAYGPTENTALCTSYHVEHDHNRSSIPIGRPVDHCAIYVVNEENHLLPFGEKGELCVGGQGLTRGYMNREELNQSRFLNGPHMEEVVYKTGDIVEVLMDGNIRFYGRVDKQVKIRGFRIEMEEIEGFIRNIPDVTEAKVVVGSDLLENKTLIAYLQSNRKITSKEVREFLSLYLPNYAIPGRIKQVLNFPLNSNGKIDIKQLEKMNHEEVPSELNLTEDEKKLLAIFQDHLRTTEISMEDDFFHLGGNSLQVNSVINAIERIFGVRISINDFYSHSKIQQLIEFIHIAAPKKQGILLKGQSANDRYQLSAPQKRVYAANHLMKGQTNYNIPYAFLLKGKVDRSKLQTALNQILAEHETLRSTFFMIDQKVFQKVNQDMSVFIKQTSLKKLDEIGQKLDEFIQPFDLEKGPLLRVECCDIQEDQTLLLFDFHHLIFDGYSESLFFHQLSDYYNHQGIESEPNEFQYIHYVDWQNQYQNSSNYQENQSFWEKYLTNGVNRLQLIEDIKSNQSYGFKKIESINIQPTTQQEIETFCKKNKMTLFSFLLNAYGILLRKVYRQNQFLIGTVSAGRVHAEFEDIIGMFVNTLPFVVNIPAEKTVIQHLKDEQLTINEMLNHQNFQFEDMLKLIDFSNTDSIHPLFDTIFIMENMEPAPFKINGKKVQRLNINVPQTMYDLAFVVNMNEGTLQFSMEYNGDKFRETTIQQLLKGFFQLLNEMIQDSSQPLGSLKITSPEEERIILEKFNPTRIKEMKQMSMIPAFKEIVAKYPDKVALKYQGVDLTYRELDEVSDRIAIQLQDLHVSQGTSAGIFLKNRMKQIISMLAILKVGGNYVPIDQEYPEQRIKYMLEKSGMRSVISDEGNNHIFISKDVKVFDYTGPVQFIQKMTKDKVPFKITEQPGEELAYILFTSGTTGQPKGVCIKHKNILRLVKGETFMKLDEHQTFLQTCNIVFDVSTLEIWGSLLNGGTLQLTDKDDILDIYRMEKMIKESNVTSMWLTTPLFNELAGQNPKIFRPLKTLIIGGDTLSVNFVNRVRRNCPDLQMINGYGPTEATTLATTYTIHTEHTLQVPIGKPIPETSIYILDESKNLLPIGAVGEIYIGGNGNGLGYIKDNKQTMEKFLPNPFGLPGTIYKTGDLGRWNEKGEIEFFGRQDHQVKIRGYRIELKEIEKVVNEHPQVSQAVIRIINSQSKKKIVCYYVGLNTSSKGLHDYLATKVPQYMIPVHWISIPKIPLTVNGKVDERELEKIFNRMKVEVEEMQEGYVAPRTEEESKITEIWQDVLGIKQVGITDDFFDLGGDSIKAIQLSYRLRKLMIDMDVSSILKHRTIKNLSFYIKYLNEGFDQKKITGEVELTPIQHWFLNQVPNEQNHFNQSMFLRTKTRLSKELICRAFDVIIEQHDMLRATFDFDQQLDAQEIQESGKYQFMEFDLANRTDAESFILAEANKFQRSLDLKTGNLVNIVLFHDQEEDHLLLIAHHLVIDYVSWRILIVDLTTAIQQQLADREIVLDEKTDSYQKYAEVLGSFYQDNRKILKELQKAEEKSSLILPVQSRQRRHYAYSSRQKVVYLNEEESNHLLYRAHQAFNTRVLDILTMALGMTFGKYTMNDEVPIYLEAHGRDHVQLDLNLSHTIGWFTNIYPVYLSKENNNDLSMFVKENKENIRKGSDYKLLSQAHLNELGFASESEHTICLNYLGQLEDDINNDLFSLSPYSAGDEFTGWFIRPTIDMTIEVKNKKFVIYLDYSTEQFTEAWIDEIALEYVSNLKRIIHYCCNHEVRELTPSDLSADGIDQSTLDQIYAALE